MESTFSWNCLLHIKPLCTWKRYTVLARHINKTYDRGNISKYTGLLLVTNEQSTAPGDTRVSLTMGTLGTSHWTVINHCYWTVNCTRWYKGKPHHGYLGTSFSSRRAFSIKLSVVGGTAGRSRKTMHHWVFKHNIGNSKVKFSWVQSSTFSV